MRLSDIYNEWFVKEAEEEQVDEELEKEAEDLYTAGMIMAEGFMDKLAEMEEMEKEGKAQAAMPLKRKLLYRTGLGEFTGPGRKGAREALREMLIKQDPGMTRKELDAAVSSAMRGHLARAGAKTGVPAVGVVGAAEARRRR